MLSKGQEFRRAWPILLASALGAGVSISPLAFYSLGAFVGPLTKEFGWSRTEISTAPLFLTTGGLIMGTYVGALADRFGARKIVLISQLLLIVALAALALLTSHIWTLYAGYFVLAILGAGTMPMTWNRAIIGWFVKSRGLAIGVSLMGTGIAGALLPTYINWLTGIVGWRGAYLGLAALPVIFGLPLTFLFFHEAPENGAPANKAATQATIVTDAGSYTLREALRTRCFWQISLAFFFAAIAIAAVLVHSQSLLMDRGIDRDTAAVIAGLLGIAFTSGRLVSGYCLDIFNGPILAIVMFTAPAIACALLAVAGTNLAICGMAIVLVGLAGGAETDIAAYFIAQYFGRLHYGAIYGLFLTLFSVGSGIGPLIVGRVYDVTGSYNPGLYGGVAAFLIAAVLAGTLKGPGGRTSELTNVPAESAQ
jgi:MFS family permease